MAVQQAESGKRMPFLETLGLKFSMRKILPFPGTFVSSGQPRPLTHNQDRRNLVDILVKEKTQESLDALLNFALDFGDDIALFEAERSVMSFSKTVFREENTETRRRAEYLALLAVGYLNSAAYYKMRFEKGLGPFDEDSKENSRKQSAIKSLELFKTYEELDKQIEELDKKWRKK